MTFSIDSIRLFFGGFSIAWRRFPITLLCSLIGTVCTTIWVTEPNHAKYFEKISIVCFLFLPVYLSAEIFDEGRRKPLLGARLLALVFFFLFYFFDLPKTELVFDDKPFLIKFFVLAIVFHLLVSVSPFLFLKREADFWQFNKGLFISILTAFLYSFTLSGGLILAMGGIRKLFDLQIDEDYYFYVLIGINGFFNTFLFTSKIPNLNKLENDYPPGLKYFTQYVLLPLVAVYISILLAYESKIIFTWALPKGWVSVMVLASAIFGILAFLLLYPVKNTNKWIQTFTKGYYWVLLPLVGLLLVAIYVRISQYGLTESRYFVATLGVWLFGVSLYFSISKTDNIKVIPLSLLLVGLVGVYAPFNAFHSSEGNQKGRLRKVLNENGLLSEGKMAIDLPKKPLDSLEKDKIYAALEYLAENSPTSLKEYLSTGDYNKLISKKSEYERRVFILKLANLPVQPYDAIYTSFRAKYVSHLALSRADYLIEYQKTGDTKIKVATIEKDVFKCFLERNTFVVNINDTEKLVFDLEKLKDQNLYELPEDLVTFKKDSKNWKLRLLVDSGSANNSVLYQLEWKLILTRK
jgi:Domain of unknown function (DUF4153)